METIILIWLGVLSLIILYSATVIWRLFSIKKRGLKQAIFDSLDGQEKLKKEILSVKEILQKHHLESEKHFHKTALVRFNPFERIGGEQSYCLALLNNQDSGIVLTFLYTKEGVRTYVKEIVQGKGRGVDLSKEEKEALSAANHN
jgi:hypothetical protein